MEEPATTAIVPAGLKAIDEKFCHECGAVIKTEADICVKCGVRQSPISRGFGTSVVNSQISLYAGFWKRVLASFIDSLISSALAGIVVLVAVMTYKSMDESFLEMTFNISVFLIGWIYFATMESSARQGTLGKLAVGIKVVDNESNKIGFVRATVRYLGKIISYIAVGIGFIMVAFTRKKQGLHDMMAGCLVVNK